MTDTCKTCRYWKETQPGAGTALYENNGAGPGFRYLSLGACRVRSLQQFPTKQEDDWCGEHQPIQPASETQTLMEACKDLRMPPRLFSECAGAD